MSGLPWDYLRREGLQSHASVNHRCPEWIFLETDPALNCPPLFPSPLPLLRNSLNRQRAYMHILGIARKEVWAGITQNEDQRERQMGGGSSGEKE